MVSPGTWSCAEAVYRRPVLARRELIPDAVTDDRGGVLDRRRFRPIEDVIAERTKSSSGTRSPWHTLARVPGPATDRLIRHRQRDVHPPLRRRASRREIREGVDVFAQM
jgi:hypothetical protein